jgi:hypothetical protein
MRPLVLLPALAWMSVSLSGCAMGPRPASTNQLFVAATNEEAVWERTVDVVHDYFEIARENKPFSGVIEIETKPKVGASVLEPWHRDSSGLHNRLESTMQSIRRRGFINISAADGGYVVAVEVYKEIEDLPGLAANQPGAATFQQANPLRRDLNLVSQRPSPVGWITLGRDPALEETMVRSLQREFSR